MKVDSRSCLFRLVKANRADNEALTKYSYESILDYTNRVYYYIYVG